eukprot:TRINITY_DN6941_c0_g1_i1.p1 TRINITY_DN6941_c0_g1~~TRINITY_DN6941_c0_g1_i1.p1  ORF type:complete len:700 (-),score=145.79 TRINITY_DN6941_c0_g1_i1:31-2130(-)
MAQVQPVALNLKRCPPDPVYQGTQSPEASVVIDFGSYKTAAGWSNETDPFLNFKTLVGKGKVGGKMRNVVGNDLEHVTMSNTTSPFVGDIPYHFGNVEAVFDHVFSHLGHKRHPIPNSVLITEPVSCPIYTRQLMSELMFECYGVPRVGFGIDALFSFLYYKRNNLENLNQETALIFRSGFNSSHVIPLLRGKTQHKDIMRIDVGGSTSTSYLQQILQLSQPNIRLTNPLVNHIKESFCYASPDYLEEMRSWRNYTRKLNLPNCMPVTPTIIQFPYSSTAKATSGSAPIEDDEKERKRQERSDRMRLMAQEKKEKKVTSMKEEREYITNIFNLKVQDPEEYERIMSSEGYTSDDLKDHLAKIEKSLNNQQAGGANNSTKKEQDFSLVDMDDDLLDDAQKKEKKKQVFLKTMVESRKVQQAKKEQEQARKSEQERIIREQIDLDPQAWYNKISNEITELKQAIAKKQQQSTARLTGRQTVQSLARMRALTMVEHEDFGNNDQDWDTYLEIDKGGDKPKGEESEKLAKLEAMLAKFWPPKNYAATSADQKASAESEYSSEQIAAQMQLTTALPRAVEVLFQPSLLGMDQMGLLEATHEIFRVREYDTSEIVNQIYITGGNMCTAGMAERIRTEIVQMRPMGEPIKVITAEDPILDAWRGARLFVEKFHDQFLESALTREIYLEVGPTALGNLVPNFASNWA